MIRTITTSKTRLNIRHLQVLVLALLITACSRPPIEERTADSELFRGVSFVGMTVTDIDRSAEFYRHGFDVSVSDAPLAEIQNLVRLAEPESALPDQARILRSTNAQLLMMDFSDVPHQHLPGAVPVNGPGIAHICYQIDKNEDAYSRFLAKGASTIGDPEMVRLSPISPVVYAYAHDPDGIVLEVEHVNMMFVPDSKTQGVDRRIRHVSFATADIDKLLDFYATFTGVEKPRRSGRISSDKLDRVSGLPGSEISMAWIQLGNLELEFIQYHSHPVEAATSPRPLAAPGYNMLVLDVSDLQRATERFVAAGGEILPEAVVLEGKKLIVGRDVDGNLVGLYSANEASPLSAVSFAYEPSA